MTQRLWYAPTAWGPDNETFTASEPDQRSRWFRLSWEAGEKLSKRYVPDVVPDDFLKTWTPEGVKRTDRVVEEARAEEAAGGEKYDPVGWMNHESIRWATLPASSMFWLLMKGGGRFAFWCLAVVLVPTIILMGVQVHFENTAHFIYEMIRLAMLFLTLPLAAWTLGSLVERFFPHWVYKRPKGPLWELNRRTGMVTLFRDPKDPAQAGEIDQQAPFAEFDGYVHNGPTHQGSMLYYPVMVHRSREMALGLTKLCAATSSPEPARALWNFLCQYMDSTAPLPDIPLFESHRHQDPVTSEHDRHTGRNPRYWRDMDETTYKQKTQDMFEQMMNL